MSERDKPQNSAGQAGQSSSSGSGGSPRPAGFGGSASFGGSAGFGGTGLALGGSDAVDVAGAGPVAVPLGDTALCENDFVRVDRVPDTALFFSGTFDGEPVEVLESAEIAEPPGFYVFRFGSRHVEAISFRVYFAERAYQGFLQVSAVDCGMSGGLQFRPEDDLRYYNLASAKLITVTRSADGFTGLTTGSVSATWIHEDGEQHVLEAEFTLNAFMGDARVRL